MSELDLRKSLDLNNDSRIDGGDLQISKDIEKLKQTTFIKNLKEYFQKFRPELIKEFEGLSDEELQDYYEGLYTFTKLLGKELSKVFILGKVSFQGGEYEFNGGVKESIEIFRGFKRELQKDFKKAEELNNFTEGNTILFSSKDLKHFFSLLTSSSQQLSQLEDFVIEQTKEVITTSSLMEGTELEKKLLEYTKSPEKAKELIQTRLDGLNFELMKTDFKGKGVSPNVLRTMSTGMSMIVMKWFNKASGFDREQFIKFIGKFQVNDVMGLVQAIIGLKSLSNYRPEIYLKTTEFMQILSSDEVNLGNGEKNKILNNPFEFQELFFKFYDKQISKQDIIKTLQTSENNEVKITGIDKQQEEQLKAILDEFGKNTDHSKLVLADNVTGFAKTLVDARSKGRETVLGFGDILSSLGEVDFLKKIIEFFLKLLGWKSFDDFTKEYKGVDTKLDESENNVCKAYFDSYDKNKGAEDNSSLLKEDFETKDNPQSKFVKDFNVIVFKKSLEKNATNLQNILSVDKGYEKRYGKYALPESVIISIAKQDKSIDVFQDPEKQDKLDEKKVLATEELILDYFIKNQIVKGMFDKNIIKSGNDIAFILYKTYVSPQKGYTILGELGKKKGSQVDKKHELVVGKDDFIKLQSFEEIMATKSGTEFKGYKDMILKICAQFDIPPEVLIRLLVLEGSHGNPDIKCPTSSAYGLTQIIDDTWKNITEKLSIEYGILIRDWDRKNPEHQLLAGAIYLKSKYDIFGNWSDAILAYHMGSLDIRDDEAIRNFNVNPALKKIAKANGFTEDTQGYLAAAGKYYCGSKIV